MADGYVQVPPDSSGKKIDTAEIQTTSGTVERQRVSIPDGVTVSGDILTKILVEQRIQNLLLKEEFHNADNLAELRSEFEPIRIAASTAASGDITPNINAATQYVRSALSAAININAVGGDIIQGDRVIFRLADDGVARALNWNAIYRAIGVTIPTTTTAGKVTYVGAIYNSDDVKWDVVAVSTQA